MRFFLAASCGLLLVINMPGCTPANGPVCPVTIDDAAREQVLLAIAPEVEFERSDGSRYTVDNFLALNDVEIRACRATYEVLLRPKAELPDGSHGLGPSIALSIDRTTNRITRASYEGDE